MSADRLVAYCQRTLGDIVSLSDQIRCSAAVAYRASNPGNNPNFGLQVQQFCCQLERIRTFSDTTLQAITFDHLSIDERLVAWLFSGEQQSCLDKLREIVDILKEDGQVRTAMTSTRCLRPAKDRLNATMAFFDKHKRLFHFLLSADIWDQERLCNGSSMEEVIHDPLQSHKSTTVTTTYDTEGEYHTARESNSEDEPENGHLSSAKRAAAMGQQKNPHRQVLEEVIRWLDGLDCAKKHHDTLKLRQEGTCMWFSKTSAYEKWRPGGYQFLWFNGKAGCGKSVFVASTIEHLKSTLQNGEVLVFFYCDFRNSRSVKPAELMRSLLSQLFHHMLHLIVDPGDLPNKILQQKSEGTLLLSDLDKLCRLVWQAARRFDRLPIVVIDALDESADIDALSRTLVELSDDVRLLVTSRPDQTIQHRFTLFPVLSMECLVKELSDDIALHVRRELDSRKQLRSADRTVKMEIGETLIKRADGRFRWVQCQLDALDRCATESGLMNVLRNLPEGLEETYEKILEEIDERKSEGEVARRTLGFLVVALAPLRLVQIVDGLSVDFVEPKGEDEIRSLVVRLSSLVTYSEDTDILTLSHFSVKEYLTCRTTLPTYHIVSHIAHAEVANMCMRHISALLKQPPSRLSVAPAKKYPILPYVLSFGFEHLAYVNAESTNVLEELKTLGSDVRYLPSHWECLCELREEVLQWPYPPWPSFRHDFEIYILIAFAPVGLLQLFLSSCLKLRFGTNALVYAADLRKTDHAIVLLKHGADVNMRSLAIDDSHRPSPLEVAIDRGNDVIVGELLQRGCLVSVELLATAVCLPWCNTRVLVKLAQTDEFAKCAHEIGDDKLLRSIFSSARPDSRDSRKTDEDHVALARRLRELGQDLSADSPFGTELIERSVRAAYISMLEYLLPTDQPPPSRFLLAAATGDTSETISVIRFLLHRGVDIHAVSPGTGDSALHLAVTCPWEPRRLELVKLLTAAGGNPHLRNARGETPSTLAWERKDVTVVEALFTCDPSLPSDILHVALQLRHGCYQATQWLLGKGANVHHTTSDGNTLLHIVIDQWIESECLALVKTFIEAGCDSTARNSKGKSALDVAIDEGYGSVVTHLLSCNVPFPPEILSTTMPHRWLTASVAKPLLRKGADVHSATPDGDTALHLAIAQWAQADCLEFTEAFIEAGGNPLACNSNGQSAWDVAIKKGYRTVVHHLLRCDAPFPLDILPKVTPWLGMPVSLIQLCLVKGADVHSTTKDGDTVLHLAITHRPKLVSLELVKAFIEAGCNPIVCNSKGKSAWELALKERHTSVVEFLLSSNAPFPSDILSSAMQYHSLTLQMTQSFLRKGANVHTTTPDGNSVLHLVIAHRRGPACLNFIKMFVEAGCNPYALNSTGKSALDHALERGYTSVARFLRSCVVSVPANTLDLEPRAHGGSRSGEIPARGDDSIVSGSDRGVPLEPAESYPGCDREDVIGTSDATPEARITHPDPRDDTSLPVAKRPRLG